jgi:hypothetical protein
MKKQIEIIDEYSDEEIMATAYVFIEFLSFCRDHEFSDGALLKLLEAKDWLDELLSKHVTL